MGCSHYQMQGPNSTVRNPLDVKGRSVLATNFPPFASFLASATVQLRFSLFSGCYAALAVSSLSTFRNSVLVPFSRVKKPRHLTEPQDSIPYSQQPPARLCTRPNNSNPYIQPYCKLHFNTVLYLNNIKLFRYVNHHDTTPNYDLHTKARPTCFDGILTISTSLSLWLRLFTA
jgi:hypothetical protein